ncbi:MAG: hypothetical protein WA971_13505 [Microbacterium sp.]
MNTSLLTPDAPLTAEQPNRQGHPPDTGDRQILTIPDAESRRRLTPADRLRLAIGLWLLEHSLREKRTGLTQAELRELARRQRERILVTETQALSTLAFDLQRGLR